MSEPADQPTPEVKLPTEGEIAKLPRWAQVAFAARCARRVQPLYLRDSPDVLQHHADALDRAIALSEAAAINPLSIHEPNESESFVRFSGAFAGANNASIVANKAGSLAATQAASAASGVLSAAHDNGSGNLRHVLIAVRNAIDAAGASKPNAILAARRDYDLLVAAAEREGWDDNTPVPPEFFGPLWPDGEPEGWPEEGKETPSGDAAIELTIEVPDDASPEDIERIVRELTDRVDDVHRAEGGRGVVIDAIEVSLSVGTPEGACR